GVRGQVAAALEDWAALERGPRRRRLLALARGVDPDPVRNSFRDPALWEDRARLLRLARQAEPARLAVPVLGPLGPEGGRAGGDGAALLAQGQRRHPDDFWLCLELVTLLARKGRAYAGEAVGYYRAALALRPDSPVVLNNLGMALYTQKHLAEAVVSLRRALA